MIYLLSPMWIITVLELLYHPTMHPNPNTNPATDATRHKTTRRIYWDLLLGALVRGNRNTPFRSSKRTETLSLWPGRYSRRRDANDCCARIRLWARVNHHIARVFDVICDTLAQHKGHVCTYCLKTKSHPEQVGYGVNRPIKSEPSGWRADDAFHKQI